MENILTTYVRTKNVFKHRLKDLKDYDTVKIFVYELDELGVNHGPLLYALKQQGEIWYDHDGNFKALKPGPIDPALLERTKKRDKQCMPLSPLHLWMRQQLFYVDLKVKPSLMPVYFQAFLKHRDKHIDKFFTVDAFSNRVHTPVVNLKSNLRRAITFCDEPTVVSLDVKQMQPTILAKILLRSIGENPFSSSIFKGEDVYCHLQKSASLPQRTDAKKLLFQLIFGKPKDDIAQHFTGDTRWISWINHYKTHTENKNPHKDKPHTNLAWLLQYSEVQVMTDIWKVLKDREIPFLTIHDDILCRPSDEKRVYSIMDDVLKGHFKTYKIVVTK